MSTGNTSLHSVGKLPETPIHRIGTRRRGEEGDRNVHPSTTPREVHASSPSSVRAWSRPRSYSFPSAGGRESGGVCVATGKGPLVPAGVPREPKLTGVASQPARTSRDVSGLTPASSNAVPESITSMRGTACPPLGRSQPQSAPTRPPPNIPAAGKRCPRPGPPLHPSTEKLTARLAPPQPRDPAAKLKAELPPEDSSASWDGILQPASCRVATS